MPLEHERAWHTSDASALDLFVTQLIIELLSGHPCRRVSEPHGARSFPAGGAQSRRGRDERGFQLSAVRTRHRQDVQGPPIFIASSGTGTL